MRACGLGFGVTKWSNHLNAGCAAAASGLTPANATRVDLTTSAVKLADFAAAVSAAAGGAAAGVAVCAVGEDGPAADAAAALAASSFFFASAAAFRAAAFALALPLGLAFASGLSGLPGLVQAFLSWSGEPQLKQRLSPGDSFS